jgi:DNA-binding MarR family transcriptional regulator
MVQADTTPSAESLAQAAAAAHAMARECLGTRVRVLSRAITRVFDEHFRDFDVTGAQLYLIGAIGYFGPRSPSDLARALSMDKSTLSRNLQRLTERGWVAVTEAAAGRGQLVSLTQSGAELLVRIQPAWEAGQGEVRALLGDNEADVLRQLGNRLWREEQGG